MLFRSLSFLSIIPSIRGQTVLLELSPQPVQIHHEANERLRLSINMQIESSHATLGESLNLISWHFPRVLSPSRFCSLPQRCREWSNPQGRNFYSSGLIKRLERSFPREPSMRILSVLFALNKRENRFHILDSLTGIQWSYGYVILERSDIVRLDVKLVHVKL